jgi:hypothetical protein
MAPRRVPRLSWAVGLTIVALLLAGASSSAASPDWTRPFRLAGPESLDVTPARIAFGPGGATAVGYSVQDMDNTAISSARVLQGRAGSRFGPIRKPAGEQQILDLAYGPSGLELLAGTSEAGRSCCSQVQALGPAHGPSFGPARPLFSGLAGATLARLISLPDRLLAVAGTERGVWVSQSAAGGDRFAAARRLSGSNQLPQSLDAIALAKGQSLLAWTARTDQVTADGPRAIYLARGSLQHAPQRQRLALTVPVNHQVDEIALARGAAQPTLAWIESWFDRSGGFHSQAKVADLAGRLRPQAVSSGGELAAGLAFAADDRGDQVLSWKACADSGSCATRVVLRRGKGRFGAVQRPGPIDAAESPAAAVSTAGTALVGWIHSGHVFAATSQTTRMSGAAVVSVTNFATDLALTAAPGGGALAVWTQGTLGQSVMGTDFRGR